MKFREDRFMRLRRSLDKALRAEWPQLERVKKRLTTLRLVSFSAKAPALLPIGTVATDGGENRLNLAPIRVQVLRVADSLGRVHFEEFIPLSPEPTHVLRDVSQENRSFGTVLECLGLAWEDLLPQSDFQRGNLLSMLRELMEWGALLELASEPPPRLLIRDGLLRSVLLNEKVFRRVKERLMDFSAKHGHLVTGVAKRSQVINYLSVALNLNRTFAEGKAGWTAIPPELEREAAPAQYRWIGDRAMGSLHVARLDAGVNVPLFPVDVAIWQRQRVDEAMSVLHETARGSFPLRGYPMALSQAHEHARLGSLEINLLESLLLETIGRRNPAIAREIQNLRMLGRELIEEAHEPDPKI